MRVVALFAPVFERRVYGLALQHILMALGAAFF
jgi:hypothetical protein